MVAIWRWAGSTVLLAIVLGAFMALDRTTLHWYVSESQGSAVRNRDLTPAPGAPVTVIPTVTPQFTAFEAQALAVQWINDTFQTFAGWDCAEPELNEARSRWTAICTEREAETPEVRVISVDAETGAARDLVNH